MSTMLQQISNFSFSEIENQAEAKLGRLRSEAIEELPSEIRSIKILTLFKQISKLKLYEALKKIPKGVLHHVHFQCCDDYDYYFKHVINDPIVYLNSKMDAFQIGTKSQAQSNSWISMSQAKSKFNSLQDFMVFLCNLTILNQQQISEGIIKGSKYIWEIFQTKIAKLFPIIWTAHLYRKYAVHVFEKFIKNGYDRVQFRIFPVPIKEYNQLGELIKQHSVSDSLAILDSALQQVNKEHPHFTAGFIFIGLKSLPPQQNQKILTEAFSLNWHNAIGIDFVQQQDTNKSHDYFQNLAVKILDKFKNCNIKKVYHAGETKNHLNKNIQMALEAGSVRIGHGINILQHPHLLQTCREKQICFEQCPISNMILGYVNDPRCAPSQLLLSLGITVSLNCDDPGKFGVQDTTMDYFVTYISSDWGLKHLKLIGMHSINHAICNQQTKEILRKQFDQNWEKWVNKFVYE